MFTKNIAQETSQFRIRFEIATGLTVYSVNYRGSGVWEAYYSAPLSEAQIIALAGQKIHVRAHQQTHAGDGTVVARFQF